MAESSSSHAAVLASQAQELYQKKKYLAASEMFGQSAESYLGASQPALAAEMRNNQAVSLLQAKKPARALEAVNGTDEIFHQAGDPAKQAMALANQATALKDLGKSSQALDLFQQAAELFHTLEEDRLYLQTMQSISSLKLRNQNLAGALFSFQKGLQAVKKPTIRQKILLRLLQIPSRYLES